MLTVQSEIEGADLSIPEDAPAVKPSRVTMPAILDLTTAISAYGNLLAVAKRLNLTHSTVYSWKYKGGVLIGAGPACRGDAPGRARMTDAWLKSAADRINRLLDEKQGIGADIADVFLEAKSKGYVPKVLRKAITRQRMEPAKRQEEDSILELYEAALDGPTREAVKLAAQGATSER